MLSQDSLIAQSKLFNWTVHELRNYLGPITVLFSDICDGLSIDSRELGDSERSLSKIRESLELIGLLVVDEELVAREVVIANVIKKIVENTPLFVPILTTEIADEIKQFKVRGGQAVGNYLKAMLIGYVNLFFVSRSKAPSARSFLVRFSKPEQSESDCGNFCQILLKYSVVGDSTKIASSRNVSKPNLECALLEYLKILVIILGGEAKIEHTEYSEKVIKIRLPGRF